MKFKNVDRIIKDNVTWEQYTRMHYATSCEDCTHFDAATETCTLNYPTQPHLRRNQEAQIKATGQVAFCRTMEID